MDEKELIPIEWKILQRTVRKGIILEWFLTEWNLAYSRNIFCCCKRTNAINDNNNLNDINARNVLNDQTKENLRLKKKPGNKEKEVTNPEA